MTALHRTQGVAGSDRTGPEEIFGKPADARPGRRKARNGWLSQKSDETGRGRPAAIRGSAAIRGRRVEVARPGILSSLVNPLKLGLPSVTREPDRTVKRKDMVLGIRSLAGPSAHGLERDSWFDELSWGRSPTISPRPGRGSRTARH